ncbi:MAG TPA: GMC oxidoreductase, partial [Pseudomonadales bacterium]|nr:GMC oxidoreductase [Pseudomonadales bacterium]
QLEKQLKINTRKPTKFTSTCVEASTQAGFKQKDGLNDGELCGYIGYQMMNYDGDKRRSSYAAFVHQNTKKNLVVKTDALVHRVVFDGDTRATAVEFEQNGIKTLAFVTKEVVLCAGALETPKLLMLSGIGPKQQLQKMGIQVVLDAPQIGKNLQDHPNVCMFYRGKNSLDCFYPQLYGFDRVNKNLPLPVKQADTCYVFYSAPASIKQSMKRMLPALMLPPNLFLNQKIKSAIGSLVELMFKIPFTTMFVEKVYGIVVILGKPNSRGEVRLASSNPRDQAIIDPAYFKDSQDLKTMIDGVMKAQIIARQNKFVEWGNTALSVAGKTQDKEKIKKWIYGAAMTTFHYCGSCIMGASEDAPVDLQLRLRGTQNVRVADASVIPEIPVSALNAPSMMIGYRAAEFILQEYQASADNYSAKTAANAAV